MTKVLTLPEWAKSLLEELYAVEASLGNILPADQRWMTRDLSRLFEDQDFGSAAADRLFERIVKRLNAEGWSDEEIAAAVNERLTSQSNVPYCGSDSVRDAIQT